MRRLGILASALVGLLAAGSAAAQAPPAPVPAPEPPPVLEAPRFDLVGRILEGVRTGGLRGRLYLVPSLSLTEEFDSNIFGTASNRESDFITRPAAGLARPVSRGAAASMPCC